jgi:hypothetical protein
MFNGNSVRSRQTVESMSLHYPCKPLAFPEERYQLFLGRQLTLWRECRHIALPRNV